MQARTQSEHIQFVSNYKKTHSVLNLQIKQKYLDLIAQGSKIQEFREIRPTTEKKYLEFDGEGYPLEEPDKFLVVYEPLECDAEKDGGNTVLVYVGEDGEEKRLPLLKKTIGDEEVEYVDYNGEECEVVKALDKKGNIILDSEGLPLYAIVAPVELHACVPKKYDAINFYIGNVSDSDHILVEVKHAHTEFYVDKDGVPLYSEHKGERYYQELMVYDLGSIICSYIAPRPNGTTR